MILMGDICRQGNTKVCVCLVRRRSVTRRYSRVLRDRGNAGRLWKLHGASERARVVQCYTHTHTHGEKRSALCVRYLILLVVNIVCVFEWHKTHPLAQWHRKSEKWMHLSAAPSVRTPPDYHLFHAKVSIFVSCCLSRRVIWFPIGLARLIIAPKFYCS
jgi:hypothetical protein